ncbi:MAG: cobyrinate a,c-diamide synthase [Candidatus Brocadia sp. AMX2]|uniref:Cobyrinate a,c-diamide synthase n=1 Tax=Candidatus Brocadia sinica JPN1 TaxID=1197129 RepID=A0ABQ0K115_9BACT|nr:MULTISPECIES: cobyrinate a,c-diamide synthase [Brocadia]MBC6933293.1 cobyrinate a,c-diamide synthase [Candidatus Brocadia sp.]MBL1170170.1 cobyrinate a,c-diamide synthase [Candidatus Brocadia sp. AMX1]NOG42536.1 cobyrinate a,c-diamide synthase [Planctomycetota bacterium]GIK11766.1 MAG: cobyrinate a,c-diamide synthase [Candidatus Brocadia sinica]MCE7867604.1 cobyrinate a,c-diamide synthase [Candidatus Brocadia sp. AMX2]
MKHTSSHYPRILIAGTHSGVGKTTITLGLMSVLMEKGCRVQGFKVGPDYIDPSHHMAITGRPSRNLDTWLMSRDVCLELFERAVMGSDMAVIEGVMGLYDGCLDGTEFGSTAHLAKILDVPVILVMDAKGMSRSAGAIALGFKHFDKDVKIQGVILNRVRSERHYTSLKKSIEGNCNIPVLGYLSFDEEIILPERHLGLVPSIEQEFSKSAYQKIGNLLSATMDIEKLIGMASSPNNLPAFQKTVFCGTTERFNFRVAVAVDEAFNFYYHDNLDLLESFGVELTYFSPMYDKYLPADIHGLYLGGGFPELHAALLASNTTMKESIRKAYRNGLVIYGECGGMMYLLEQMVDFKKKIHEMCGILKGMTKMENKRQGLGYITVEAIHDNLLCKKGDVFKAHEFHWSSLHVSEGTRFAYAISKCDDNRSRSDGLFADRVLGSYTHVHFATEPGLVKHFLRTMGSA